MKSERLIRILDKVAFVLSLFNLVMFFSMRCCWGGISSALGYGKSLNPFIYYLPLLVCILYLIVFILNFVFYFFVKKKKLVNSIVFTSIGVVFFVILIVIYALGAKDYFRFIMFDFLKVSLLVLGLTILGYLIFFYPKSSYKDNKVVKAIAFSSVVVVSLMSLLSLTVNFIQYKPVVYVVEDEYQIVFSSSVDSIGYVKVNGKKYTDSISGGLESSRVHKISVPQKELDSAKSYVIGSEKIFYKGPFGGFKGRLIEETYTFKPVDTSDGLSYYSLSDIHMEKDGSFKASEYNESKEMLVLVGDIISMVDTYEDANFVNEVAYDITKGSIPVIYARGNHEVKGNYASKLYRFVGSKNQKFYYNFTLDNIYGVVLDIGEDHDDDWWEYYNTANYEAYREEQVEFLNDEYIKGDYELYEYRMLISHIPLPFINSRHNHVDSKKKLVSTANRMNFSISLSGHQHDLMIFEPGLIEPETTLTYNKDFYYKGSKYKGYLLDFNFPTFLVSKRGYTQTDSSTLYLNHAQIGLNVNVDFLTKNQKVFYNNILGEKISVVNPFFAKSYGEEINIDLITRTFK